VKLRRSPAREVLLLALVILGAPLVWLGTDALERQNDFCNACHIEQDGRDVALHIDIRRDMDGSPPMTLVASHALGMPAARPEDPGMRCIDCHGGVGLAGRARVKLLAARDTLVWLSGSAREPETMRHPLRDADCRQCHEQYQPRESEFEPVRFHEVELHNVDLGRDCVWCHIAHDRGGDEEFYFLEPLKVRARCADCHTEFKD
jgi:nitrate/TMAO reductase-like tetraheme cytochrome c subunit